MKKRSLLFSVVAAFGFTTASMAQVPNYVPTNGLVGWWPFNGNANDLSGNNLNGNVIGAALTSDRFGNTNSAYNFDYTTVGFGTQTDEIYIPFSPILNAPSISISIWVYQRQYFWSGNSNPPMSTLAARFQFGYSNPSGQVWMLNSGTNGINGFANAPNISLNQWTHIVSTFENGTGNIYINGQLISTQNNLSPLNIAGNSGISIGESNQANGYWWPTDGILDDFALWNRALSPCEIIALYNGQNPTQPLTACYETATFNTTTCQWDVTGTQPTQPTTACYETATFNTTTCQWDVTGTQPTQPTTACYETATFNTTTCQWDVTGSPASISQPTNQTVNINNNAQFIVSSSDPSATYQWQTNLGVGFQNLNSVGQYSGTTTNTLTVSNVTMSNNNQPFRCIINSGSCSDTSNIAVLTVNNNVGINEFTQNNSFSVYPNPAKSQINVKADAKLLGSIYTVYDNTGKLVLSGKIISENTTIELDDLSGGIYLFSVGENLEQTFKVIKE